MPSDNVTLAYPAADVLLMCLRMDSADQPIALRRLRNHFGQDVNTAKILRQFLDNGWVVRGHGSTTRVPNYALTLAGQAQAQATASEKARSEDLAEQTWRKDHVVFNVPRDPSAGPLNAKQIQAWVNGYWREQVAQCPPPENAPPEVKEAWSNCGARIDRYLTPFNPHTGRRDTGPSLSSLAPPALKPPRPR